MGTAYITTKAGPFTGQVGPVSFIEGEAETDIATMIAHFRRDPARYEVEFADNAEDAEDAEDADPETPEGETEGKGDDNPDDNPGDDSEDDGEPDTEDVAEDSEPDEPEHDSNTEPRDGDGDGIVHDGTEDEHPVPDPQYDDMNRGQLREAARERNLSTSGNTDDLRARLREADQGNG